MPSFRPIQLIPPGLLGLFQLKQEGRGIVELPDILQPTVDLLKWYMQARAEYRNNLGFTTAAANTRDTFEDFGPTSTLIVPSREYWYVHQYTCWANVVPGAGTASVRMLAPAFAQDTNHSQPLVLGPAYQNTAAGSAVDVAMVSAFDFFLPAGAELGFAYAVECAGGGVVNFMGNARITVLPI